MSSVLKSSVTTAAAVLAVAALCAPPAIAQTWQFVDQSQSAGVNVQHALAGGRFNMPTTMAAGVAAADFDRDGWVDIYVVTGDTRANALFRNNGGGTYTDVAASARVELTGRKGAGPAFADLNGDKFPDLVVGGVEAEGTRILLNQQDGTFTDVTINSGILPPQFGQNDFSHAFADVDKDGDLDMFIAHWGFDRRSNHLYLNDGTARFQAADSAYGFVDLDPDFSFTPNFVDINGDQWPDLLLASDFGTSRVYLNENGERFVETTDAVISDENGMGATVGDFDNDGDQDWFVSSIWDPNGIVEGSWGKTGNRLYRNNGDGTFVDATTESGVREGYWGWGACAADFNNDGWLDIFHVNGFAGGEQVFEFIEDPARLYINDGDGTFTERSAELGLVHTGQGRGVVCFDHDQDGDVDVFIANNEGPFQLFENQLPANNYFGLRLEGADSLRSSANARVTLIAGGETQVREVMLGNHYESQSPPDLHFGLGEASAIDSLLIQWADGGITRRTSVEANQVVLINQGGDIGEMIDPSRNGSGGGVVPDPDLVEGDGDGDGSGGDSDGDPDDSDPYGLNDGAGAADSAYSVPIADWLQPLLILLLLASVPYTRRATRKANVR